jgi:hypothetical protein
MYTDNPEASMHMHAMGVVFDLRTPAEYQELFRVAYRLEQIRWQQIPNEKYHVGHFNRDVGTLFVYPSWCFLLSALACVLILLFLNQRSIGSRSPVKVQKSLHPFPSAGTKLAAWCLGGQQSTLSANACSTVIWTKCSGCARSVNPLLVVDV